MAPTPNALRLGKLMYIEMSSSPMLLRVVFRSLHRSRATHVWFLIELVFREEAQVYECFTVVQCEL